MKKSLFLAVVLMAAASYAVAASTVCTFDTFSGAGTVPDGYCGITWGGNWGYFDAVQPPYTPFSPTERVFTPNTGAGEYMFTLGSPAVFEGAYFAGYPVAELHFNLYDSSDHLLWTSASLVPSATPSWLASGYSGLVSVVGVDSASNDRYVMDNVTYSGAPAVPEPGTLVLLGSGLLALGSAVLRKIRL